MPDERDTPSSAFSSQNLMLGGVCLRKGVESDKGSQVFLLRLSENHKMEFTEGPAIGLGCQEQDGQGLGSSYIWQGLSASRQARA